ncbi:MAG: phage tail protein [Acidobacteria bacterium]|nr:phage tail protein [Acidobacteriota bacterium]
MDGFIGEIKMFGGTFAPLYWRFCDGSLLSIAEYNALYALIGTIYGGDGVSNFRLPDLRGRLPVHQGEGPGLTPRSIGQAFGTETVTLAADQLGGHTHSLSASGNPAGQTTPGGNLPGLTGVNLYTTGTSAPVSMNAASVAPAGSGQPHDNLMPALCVHFIICCEGVFPTRP